MAVMLKSSQYSTNLSVNLSSANAARDRCVYFFYPGGFKDHFR